MRPRERTRAPDGDPTRGGESRPPEDTTIYVWVGTSIPGRAAHGYLGSQPGLPIAPGRLVDVTTVVSPSAWGAGQIVSTADDVTRFFAALLGGRLLRAAQLAAMKTRVKTVHLEQGVPVRSTENYGLGLRIEPTPCGTAYGHDGDLPGYRSVVLGAADGRRVAALMVNVDESRVPRSRLVTLAANAFCAG